MVYSPGVKLVRSNLSPMVRSRYSLQLALVGYAHFVTRGAGEGGQRYRICQSDNGLASNHK